MSRDNQRGASAVFLSHAAADRPWVRKLYERLSGLGIEAYLDEVAIDAGDNFVRNLSDGIGYTSSLVIVVSASRTDRPWVEHEWTSFMATHGPRNTIIPVLLDDVSLPPFLRPFQAIVAFDRDVTAVADRIARVVNEGDTGSTPIRRSTGKHFIFTMKMLEHGSGLLITQTDGSTRTYNPPWRESSSFEIALRDFSRLTREKELSQRAHARLTTAAKTIGTALFDVLFSDQRLLADLAVATAPGERPVLTVQSNDDVLLSLPWELLFHESRFLVREGLLDIVRSTIGVVQFDALLTPPINPFSIVTHVAAPEGSALSYEEESFRLTRALTDHCEYVPTELGTLEDFLNTVSRERPRGIHFSGHGTPGALVFEDDQGFEDPITINRLLTELRQNGNGELPPFFYLASCHGNTTGRSNDGDSASSSSAAQLHAAGVVEVVCYSGPIADELSTRAEEALYSAIAAGESTRLAVTKARAALGRAFEGEINHRPASADSMAFRSLDARGPLHVAPFAWAQLVLYRRGPEYPLGTPASPASLRLRESGLRRSHHVVAGQAFLASGFIGRRRDLHRLRRLRRRGDRVFVLQGLGGLGKTTLAGQLLPLLAEAEHTIVIWCQRTEGQPDQSQAIASQLFAFARTDFGQGFEAIVRHADRTLSDGSQRFIAVIRAIVERLKGVPVAIYFDNLESLLLGPPEASAVTPPQSGPFGSWRTENLRRLWLDLVKLANLVDNLYVVASSRYRNDDLEGAVLSVSALTEPELIRLMGWFPSLRRLSTQARLRLADRLSGHPRAVEFLDALIASSIHGWEKSHGEWVPPSPGDNNGLGQEWESIVAPVLPDVKDKIWADLLLSSLWDQVLDERAHRMLLRMTLPRRPWEEGLLAHLAEQGEASEDGQRTVGLLVATALLEQTLLTTTKGNERLKQPFFCIHPATATFVKNRVGDDPDFVMESHQRIGTYLEELMAISFDLPTAHEAGYHLFEAREFERAFKLLGVVSDKLRDWGNHRESLQILVPFLNETIQDSMTRPMLGRLIGTVGSAHAALGETRRAIGFYKTRLQIANEVGDRPGEAIVLGNLGAAYATLGEVHTAIEHQERSLAICREIGNRSGECNALSNLGNAYRSLGEVRRAVECYEQALTIAIELGYQRGQVGTLANLGLAHFSLGNSLRAIEYLEKGLTISQETGDRLGQSHILDTLGSAYSRIGQARHAIDLYDKGLVLAREVGNRRGESKILGNLGIAYEILGEIRRSIEYHEQELSVCREISDLEGADRAMFSLGNRYLALGEHHRALDQYEHRLVIARQRGDRDAEALTLGNMGLALFGLGDTLQAVACHKDSLRISRETGDQLCETRALANLGFGYETLSQVSLAMDFYDQCLSISTSIQDQQSVAFCEAGLARCRTASS